MDFVCPYACSYRTNSGYCGRTGGWEHCQYRQLHKSNTVIGYVPPLKNTNADRIRSKTDEKLAEWLAHLTDCVNCPCRDPNDQCNTVDDSCQKQWLDWLKKEN